MYDEEGSRRLLVGWLGWARLPNRSQAFDGGMGRESLQWAWTRVVIMSGLQAFLEAVVSRGASVYLLYESSHAIRLID